jgi:hypothetical protein
MLNVNKIRSDLRSYDFPDADVVVDGVCNFGIVVNGEDLTGCVEAFD